MDRETLWNHIRESRTARGGDLRRRDGSHVAVSVTTYSGGSASVRRENFTPAARSYASQHGKGRVATGECEVLTSDDARPEENWSLSHKLAAGLPFLLVSDAERLKVRPGPWEYPRGRWVVLEGKYHVDSGTWAVQGVGFDPGRTNSYHSCPPAALLPDDQPPCGGIHQPGYTMDRWYRPEKHKLVVFGRVYTFDEAGRVSADGTPIGRLLVPGVSPRRAGRLALGLYSGAIAAMRSPSSAETIQVIVLRAKATR